MLFFFKNPIWKALHQHTSKMTYDTMTVCYHIFTWIYLFVLISRCIYQAFHKKQFEAGGYQGFAAVFILHSCVVLVPSGADVDRGRAVPHWSKLTFSNTGKCGGLLREENPEHLLNDICKISAYVVITVKFGLTFSLVSYPLFFFRWELFGIIEVIFGPKLVSKTAQRQSKKFLTRVRFSMLCELIKIMVQN